MKLKKERGITLISLVVTIIVLIILAGVTINITIGQNGLITKAKEAVEEQKIGTVREKLVLAIAEYEVQMRKETMYSILNKVEGMEAIEPDDEQAGLPYTVIVDGYEFLITEKLEITYQGKASAELPEIISVEKSVVSDEQVKITLQAKIDENEGLDKVILIKDKVEIETRVVTGKEVTEEFIVTGNGTYTVKVVGKNKRQKISEEIQVTEIAKLSGTLQAGTVVDGEVLLTITGQTQEGTIKEIQICKINGNSETSITQIACEDNTQTVEKEYTIYIPFSEENNYLAKIIDNNNNSVDTNTIVAENSNSIKTEEDLQTLATLVNNGNTYEGETINLLNDITVTNHQPIGYFANKGDWTGPYFAGTFEGRNNQITIQSIVANSEQYSTGIFGMVIGGNINNLIANGTNSSVKEFTAGIVGCIKDGEITNCINKCDITDKTKNIKGGIVGAIQNSTINNCNNTAAIYGYTDVGGICGRAYNDGTVTQCVNEGDIYNYGYKEINWKMNGTDMSYQYGTAGGIMGYMEDSNIDNCYNSGNIYGKENSKLYGVLNGGIVGRAINSKIEKSKNDAQISYFHTTTTGATSNGGALGGICGLATYTTIEQCFNEGKITSKNSSGNYCLYNEGGIVGYLNASNIKNCYNLGQVLGKQNVGGIVGFTDVAETTDNSYVYNCYNANANLEAESLLGNFIGESNKTIGSNNSSITGISIFGKSTNDSWTNHKQYTTTQMVSQSDLLNLLNTNYGSGLWAKDTSINDGYPYLINNQP